MSAASPSRNESILKIAESLMTSELSNVTADDVRAYVGSLMAKGTPWATGCAAVLTSLFSDREILRAKSMRSESTFITEDAALAAIENEPELPGAMPDEMWAAMNGDRDATQEAMRIAVRQTKAGIRRRLLALLHGECKSCPHVVGDAYQRDCAFPDCLRANRHSTKGET